MIQNQKKNLKQIRQFAFTARYKFASEDLKNGSKEYL